MTTRFCSRQITHCHTRVRAQRADGKGLEKGLKAPYQGPYCVISRTKKHFTIDLDGEEKTLSIDQLKPAFLPVKLRVETIHLLTSRSVSKCYFKTCPFCMIFFLFIFCVNVLLPVCFVLCLCQFCNFFSSKFREKYCGNIDLYPHSMAIFVLCKYSLLSAIYSFTNKTVRLSYA